MGASDSYRVVTLFPYTARQVRVHTVPSRIDESSRPPAGSTKKSVEVVHTFRRFGILSSILITAFSFQLPSSPSELQAGSAANVGYDFLTLRYTLHDRHNDSVQLTIDSVSSPRYTKYCVQDAISCDRDMRRCGLLQHSLLTYSSLVDTAGTRPSAQVGYSPTNSAFQLGSRGS